MAGLVPAIHVLLAEMQRRGCPHQVRAWRMRSSGATNSASWPDWRAASWPGSSRPSTSSFLRCKDVDARVKPAHDEW